MTRAGKLALSEGATMFRAADDQALIYRARRPGDGQVLHSPDGLTYDALAVTGLRGRRLEHDLAFWHPHQQREGQWRRRYAEVTLDGVSYKLHPTPQEITTVPLPSPRKRADLLRLGGDGYLYVSRHADRDAAYRLFVGDAGRGRTLREIPVGSVALESGTMYVHTDEATLVRRADGIAIWDGAELQRPDPDQFVIRETEAGVTIVPWPAEADAVPGATERALTLRDAKDLLRSWHKQPAAAGMFEWRRHPSDRDYAAVGVPGDSPYVQIWVPDRESIVFGESDADDLLRWAGNRPRLSTADGANMHREDST